MASREARSGISSGSVTKSLSTSAQSPGGWPAGDFRVSNHVPLRRLSL
ncbi:hypothetical protein FOQG_19541 [Fusarium oxysporum f. sp. raphani 54005]|uniref:Uncharacterized protein n=1 Tax=Fusarium oxysporum f. sp. raphani 54005 TaxID=1089458 RepID=X0BYU0_FUSOX|nr:hypothetical protein FOQG_19541 [Fusarium oxysporum f. sp. raphani 54005]